MSQRETKLSELTGVYQQEQHMYLFSTCLDTKKLPVSNFVPGKEKKGEAGTWQMGS